MANARTTGGTGPISVDALPVTLTAPEAAEVFRIGVGTMWKAIRDGDVKVVRIKGTVRVPRHEVERLLGISAEEDEALR